jgi:raffinose/stachyose/melibiose transport system permease protein
MAVPAIDAGAPAAGGGLAQAHIVVSGRSKAATEAPPGEPRRIAYLYILPGFLIYLAFMVAPALHTVYLSFFTWSGINPPPAWDGLGNYTALLRDPTVIHAFLHSLVLIAFFSALPIMIGLFVTTLIARVEIRGRAFFRGVLFLPQVIATVSIAVIWRWIYSYDGPLNGLFRSVGLGGLVHTWLGDFTWALPSLGLIGTWFEFGLCMVLFLAGVQKIPATLYDAARVDGASAWHEFRVVTLPGLRNEIVVVATITIIAALRSFDLVYVTTAGGPGTSTDVPALEIYNRAFTFGEVGSGAAIATMLSLIIAVIAIAVTRLGSGKRTSQ